MKHRLRTILPFALALIALAATTADVSAAQKTNKAAVKKGVSWIGKAGMSQFGGTGFEADTLSALMAAKRSGAKVTSNVRARFLKTVTKDANNYAQTAGSSAKVILAAVAGGKNPRCFGPAGETTDFYDALMSYYDAKTGQFGATAFDQGFAMLALKAAHVKVPSKAVKFARERRGQYGWGFAMRKTGGDDVESTSVMIQGMRAAGVKRTDGALKSAMKWIVFQRNVDGGYNPTTASTPGETQADTTAYAIMAGDAVKLYSHQMDRAKRALRALQQGTGAFRSSVSANSDFHGISTGNAVFALSGQHFPVVVRSKAAKACV
ncbi:MAG: hypothetical protein QM648_11075 [Solirubrobacterales bacterium]